MLFLIDYKALYWGNFDHDGGLFMLANRLEFSTNTS